jgi:hypothetical protein
VSEQTHQDADGPMPEWLWAELVELAEAFDHLPPRARYDAMKRNLSPRAHDYFDRRAERRVRERAEDDPE